MPGIIQPGLPLASEEFDYLIQDAIFAVVDHVPDQTDTYSSNGTGKEPKGTMHGFESDNLGIHHHDKNKRQADLSDDTGDDQVDIVAESLPEGRVVKQLDVLVFS